MNLMVGDKVPTLYGELVDWFEKLKMRRRTRKRARKIARKALG